MSYINDEKVLGGIHLHMSEGGTVDIEVDQTYKPKSTNAQSGKAVAEAIKDISVSRFLEYEWHNTEVLIQGCDKSITGDLIIPSKIDSAPVKIIENNVFENCTGLTSVTILDGLTRIGDYAFNGCGNIAIMHLPDSIEHIGAKAFSNIATYNNPIIIYFDGTPEQWLNISIDCELDDKYATIYYNQKTATVDYVNNEIGDIETALDRIIAIQNELIGGGNV